MEEQIIRNLLEDENVRKGTYEFIDNTDFTYADIHILIKAINKYKQQIDELVKWLESKINDYNPYTMIGVKPSDEIKKEIYEEILEKVEGFKND